MPKRTVFHLDNETAAQEACHQLALNGWAARWSVDGAWTHVHVMHEPHQARGPREILLQIDPDATSCECG